MRWLLLLLVLCCISGASAIQISEVMYDPVNESEEWLELYNDGATSVNLSGWTVLDPTKHTLSLVNGDWILAPGAYSIIAESAATFAANYSYTGMLLEASSLGLNNDGDWIALNDSSGNIVENATYSDIADEGNTIQLVDGVFCEGIPTPGSTNDCADDEEPLPEEEQYDLKLEVKIQNATQGTDAKNLFKLTNLDYKTNQPYMNVTVEFTVKLNSNLEFEDSFTVEFKQSKSIGTGEWTPESFGTYELCGEITDAPFKDPGESNNDACEDIIVYENETILEEVQENNNITADENRTLGISLRNSTANASAKGDYVTGAYTWRSGSTSIGVAFWLFTAVLLIFVVLLLLMLLRKQNP